LASRAVRGFKDILPADSMKWNLVEETARDVFWSAGLREIRTPVLEKTEVFARGIGEHTDIVEKEMYTFADRNGDSLTLRPEATAGILRAVIENKLYAATPFLKLFTMGPMFRHERPQKGRLRQFHQINVEYLGSSAPCADAEVIWLAWEILNNLTTGNLKLELNTLGCPKCRPAHRADLDRYLKGVMPALCDDCRRRSHSNPLRVFDCKNGECRKQLLQAPLVKHYMCIECAEHLGAMMDALESMDVPFVQNPWLVRGLDYYTRTAFEIVSSDLGAQSTVAAGGRYDSLVKELGGPDMPGVGMAIGVERVLLLLDEPEADRGIDLFVAALGRDAREEALQWVKELRVSGISVEISFEDKSLKAQMKQADRSGASHTIIIGENELEEEEVVLRNMKTREQVRVAFDEVVEHMEKIFTEGEM